ncbi:MAG TPA: transcriptional repressor [Pyrinomonadaceae bacterium]|nr:transcriptional repressor [Pyrinomonadaceae bacterium]
MARKREGQGGARAALTPQREVVLRVVRGREEHMTANEIFEAARGLLPTISFATVYNSLRYLKDAGLIGEVTFGNGASRFDRETARHDHAVCSNCGRLTDFDLPATTELVRAAARRTRFKPESIHLTLVGLCPDCRAGE